MATCDVCNRQLTDPESIARGRGPVCAGGRCVSLVTTRVADAAQGVLWAVQLELAIPADASELPKTTPSRPDRTDTAEQLPLDLPAAKRRG